MHVFGERNGIKFRVKCDRQPTPETMNAINKMVELITQAHVKREKIEFPLHSSGSKHG